ncbi:MAG: alpha/beta fold hydrolase [Microlunatus sp.]|nr:alpha/beta fold hydrolase [Microlunatus sp.]
MVEIHHTRVGDQGPRIVLLHGLFGQGKNWTSVAKALSDRAQVILIDLPNHGRSGWTDRVTYAQMADAVVEVLTQDGDEQLRVVGHSMGGKVAMAMALLQPHLVERLVVTDIAPVRYQQLSSFGEYVTGMRSIDLSRVVSRSDADRRLRPYVPDDVVRSFLLQNLRRDADSESGWRWQVNLSLLGAQLADLGDWPDLSAPPYPGPVLWVAGAQSDYITEAYARAMRRLFPRTQLITIKNAGHWVHSEQPEVFVATLRRFFALDDR